MPGCVSKPSCRRNTPSACGGGGERRSPKPMTRLVRGPLHHQDELRVGHAADPEDPVVRDEAGVFRRLDRFAADEVSNRRQPELRDEAFPAHDVALVKPTHLDLELALAERLAD